MSVFALVDRLSYFVTETKKILNNNEKVMSIDDVRFLSRYLLIGAK